MFVMFDDLLALLSLFESSLVACVCTFQKLLCHFHCICINFETC